MEERKMTSIFDKINGELGAVLESSKTKLVLPQGVYSGKVIDVTFTKNEPFPAGKGIVVILTVRLTSDLGTIDSLYYINNFGEDINSKLKNDDGSVKLVGKTVLYDKSKTYKGEWMLLQYLSELFPGEVMTAKAGIELLSKQETLWDLNAAQYVQPHLSSSTLGTTIVEAPKPRSKKK